MKVKYDVEKLRKIASYIGSAQPVVEKSAAEEALLAKRVPQLVDTLISQGLVTPHLKEAKIRSLKSGVSELLDTIEKMAGLIQAPSLGTGSDKVEEKADANTVFENRLFGRG